MSADIYKVAVPKELDLERRDECRDTSDLLRTGKLLWVPGSSNGCGNEEEGAEGKLLSTLGVR